jgi:hypothetical protein
VSTINPAFAYALVALLLVPVVRELRPRMEDSPPAASFDQRAGDGARIAEALRSEPGAPAPRPEAAAAPSQPRVAVPLAPAPALVPPVAPPPPAPALRERRADAAMAKRALAAKPQAEAESRGAADSPALLPQQEGAPAARGAEGAVAKTEPLPEALGALAAGAGLARSRSSTAAAERDDEKAGGADRAMARALSDRREHAAPAATAGEGPFVLEIGAERPTIVRYVPVARAVRLRVLPNDLVSAPLDVWVRERAGQREIHRRVTDPAHAIDIDLPLQWLVPGVYAVTLQPVDGGAPATLTFTVPMPTCDRD